MSDSLADRAVHALALVAAMGENLSNDDPERHIVRNMKRTAEQAMSNAFQLASDLAYQAKDVSDTFAKLKDKAQ
jgi:hypothetical protein